MHEAQDEKVVVKQLAKEASKGRAAIAGEVARLQAAGSPFISADDRDSTPALLRLQVPPAALALGRTLALAPEPALAEVLVLPPVLHHPGALHRPLSQQEKVALSALL